ncbi:MAG: hypothetical protein BGO41_12535 [Clostridiales bacterium 38-18]|nr:MAG: hypothetical protein BGO41_12535 [Clostridiales bacterium 38-18]
MRAENFLEHTRQTWKRQYLIIALILLFIAFIFIFIGRESVIRVLTTPEFKTYDELLVASTLDSKGLFQTAISYDDMYYFNTAFYGENDNIESYYAALINADGNFTLAEIPAVLAEDENTARIVGTFVDIPSDLYDYITEELIELGFTESEAAEMMPINLYLVKDNEVEGYVFIAIALLLILAMLYFILRIFQVSNGSLINKRLSKLGDVDRYHLDLERTPVSLAHPNLAISGTNYILLSDKKLNFIPITNVVWAYEYVKKRKAYFLITVSKQHYLVIADHKTKHFSQMKATEVNACLNLINKISPWAIVGFTKETDKLYSNSRETFINSVSTHKESINVDEGFDLEGKYS